MTADDHMHSDPAAKAGPHPHVDSEHRLNSTDLRVVKFHGDEIVTFENEGRRYVAMRRIVENMGMAWQRQSVKLMDQKDKFNCHHMVTVGDDGKLREMLCMPVEKLQLWLASINPNKIANEAIRAKVERYQAESAIVLHDYWTSGAAGRASHAPIDEERIAAIAATVLRAMVPEIMKASLANGARNVRGWLLAVQVADRYGVLAKGRGKFVQRVSSRLKKFCEERGWAMQAEYREDGKQPRRMFSVEAVAAWARQEGLAIVTMHLAKQPFARPAPEGQGVLPFVRQPKK